MGSSFREEVLQDRRGDGLGAINLATPLSFIWWALLAAAILLFPIFGLGQFEPSAGLLALAAQMTCIVHSHAGARKRARQGTPAVAGILGRANQTKPRYYPWSALTTVRFRCSAS